MKDLLNRYRNLPPEMRAVATLVGFTGVASVIWAVHGYLTRTMGYSQPVAVFIMLGLIIGINLLWVVIVGVAKWFSRRRQRGLQTKLVGAEYAGPVAMDVRDTIRSNNQKFFTAVKDMKHKLGLSVYDLPWYIVIGDSGCGKTKLINESGLTFSAGKPEGHQLGTLNYNWWFTEDCIFVDMAGRLVNPQEDKDHKEWLGFLTTVKAGRPVCPINGALVCVSAEHLLQDTPDKWQGGAENMLLRLRELQHELGVTFPTYLIVTKCDKIVGFMEFFDRARRGLLLKLQMVGWSREGAFDGPYSPDTFKHTHDGLYDRLHELRLRRLKEESTDQSRESAYSFPEEFRNLHEPLQIYIQTLFPELKNPRGVKNLLFRGVYFTSATQAGEMIMPKAARETLGVDARRAYEDLEKLYPTPEPHFLKDILLKKAVPEQGLVFRNRKQMQWNQRLRLGLLAGSVALLGLGLWGFFWSQRAFNQLMADPREHAIAARYDKPLEPPQGLRLAGLIHGDVGALQRSSWATRLLARLVQGNSPVYYLREIHSGLMRYRVLGLAAARVRGALADEASLKGADVRKASAYVDALEHYLKWASTADQKDLPNCLGAGDLHAMARFAPLAADAGELRLYHWAVALNDAEDKSSPVASASAPATEAERGVVRFPIAVDDWFAHSGALSRSDRRNPSRPFKDQRTETVAAAVSNLAAYYQPWAKLERLDEMDDKELMAALRLVRSCRQAMGAYTGVLGTRDTIASPKELAGLQKAIKVFKEKTGEFSSAIDGCKSDALIPPAELWKRLCRFRGKQWGELQKRLGDAASGCPDSPGAVSLKLTLAAELDRAMWDTLTDWRLVSADQFSADVFTREGSPPEGFRGVGVWVPFLLAEKDKGGFEPSREAVAVRDVLNEVAGASQSPQDLGGSIHTWNAVLAQHVAFDPEKKLDELEPKFKPIAAVEWHKPDLQELTKAALQAVTRTAGTTYLTTIRERLVQSTNEKESRTRWGLAELLDGWNQVQDSPFQILAPVVDKQAPTPPAGWSHRRTGGGTGRGGGQRMAVAATRNFLNDLADQAAKLSGHVHAMRPDIHFAGEDSLQSDVHAALKAAWAKYIERYFSSWKTALERDPGVLSVLQSTPGTMQAAKDALSDRVLASISPVLGDYTEHVLCADYADWTAPDASGSAGKAGDLDERLAGEVGREFQDIVTTQRRELLGVKGSWESLRTEGGRARKSPFDQLTDEYGDAWTGLRGEIEQLMRGERLSGEPFQRFQSFGQRYPQPEFGPVQSAVEFERRLCALLLGKLQEDFAALRRRMLSLPCTQAESLREEFKRMEAQARGCQGSGISVDVLDNHLRCCEQKQQLAGATITVKIVNTPNPGTRWKPNLWFAKGELVVGPEKAEWKNTGDVSTTTFTLQNCTTIRFTLKTAIPNVVNSELSKDDPVVVDISSAATWEEFAKRIAANPVIMATKDITTVTGKRETIVVSVQCELPAAVRALISQGCL